MRISRFTSPVRCCPFRTHGSTSPRRQRDKGVGIVGYEINFNRFFYKLRSTAQVGGHRPRVEAGEAEIAALLGEVTE